MSHIRSINTPLRLHSLFRSICPSRQKTLTCLSNHHNICKFVCLCRHSNHHNICKFVCLCRHSNHHNICKFVCLCRHSSHHNICKCVCLCRHSSHHNICMCCLCVASTVVTISSIFTELICLSCHCRTSLCHVLISCSCQ